MPKITYEQKMEFLNRYKTRPMAVNDPDIIEALRLDVVKASSNGTRKARVEGPEQQQDNSIYNPAMGLYRDFMKTQNSYLDMKDPRKAKKTSDAMRKIIEFMQRWQRDAGKPHDAEAVLNGIRFMFTHWDRLNDYHKKRIQLPDIYNNIAEILPMIANGKDAKTAAKDSLNNLKSSIKNKQYSTSATEA